MSLSDAAYERLTMARNDFKIFHELFGGILDIPDTHSRVRSRAMDPYRSGT